MDDETEETFEYTVWATVKLAGAWMSVSARNKEEAIEIAERTADFDTSGAEMTDWVITGVQAE